MTLPSKQVLFVFLCAASIADCGCVKRDTRGLPRETEVVKDVAPSRPSQDKQLPDSSGPHDEVGAKPPAVDDDDKPDEVIRGLPFAKPSDITQSSDVNESSVASTDDGTAKTFDSITAGYAEVKVFYGTDREPVVTRPDSLGKIVATFATAIMVALVAILSFVAARSFPTRRLLFRTLALLAVVATVILVSGTSHQLSRQRIAAERNSIYYGAGRGELEYGVAKVSIPKAHKIGALEAPSILRLEFKEDPAKHVVVLNVSHRSEDGFFAELDEKLRASSERELFIFVHGFSVTFEDAVRRTAQIAYDMDFAGAPITYSWPSQGSIFGYAADEESVQYTVAHFKEFIFKIKTRNPATSINLVAHSMGNRALTMVLKEIALEQGQNSPPNPPNRMFNEVVLAAPDVDADVFKQRALSKPSILDVANRVTLYASSNDRALLLSKKVHGFQRAGETGEGLVVIPGVDTIDVSQIDLSILGHSYYGDSQPIIREIKHAMLLRQAATQRSWLQPVDFGENLKYWLYSKLDALPRKVP